MVGLPNAGKSTFLASVSAAKPKIADYPFTTLHPNLGVVKVGNLDFVLADIPGLIEGAHEGSGIGDRFLGHIERCSVILHLIDATEPDPVKSYETVRKELIAYGGDLESKTEIVGLSKCDALDDEERRNRCEELQQALNREVIPLSAVSKLNIEKVLYVLGDAVRRMKEDGRQAEAEPVSESQGWQP